MEHRGTKTQSFIFFPLSRRICNLFFLLSIISPCLCASVFNIKA